MNWLTQNWHELIPKPFCAAVLAVCAVVCGAWVGSEREHRSKPAGLRTMAFVALGSAVFTIIGFAFTSSTGDSGRVAAQIVTGIGFLGAGALVHGSGSVQGLTTAATIWLVAAIGMSVGAGYAPAGFGLALTVRILLSLVGRWEMNHFGTSREVTIGIVFDANHGKTEIKLERLLEEFAISRNSMTETDAGEGRKRWTIRFRLAGRHAQDFYSELVQIPEIYGIER